MISETVNLSPFRCATVWGQSESASLSSLKDNIWESEEGRGDKKEVAMLGGLGVFSRVFPSQSTSRSCVP